jgi:hypothetical protein
MSADAVALAGLAVGLLVVTAIGIYACIRLDVYARRIDELEAEREELLDDLDSAIDLITSQARAAARRGGGGSGGGPTRSTSWSVPLSHDGQS